MPRLSALLSHFSLHAGVFYTGNLCGAHDFERDVVKGHLHLIRQGVVRMTGVKSQTLHIAQPTLVFLPRPERHRLVTLAPSGAEVVCGTIRFGQGGRNPITDSLPDMVAVPLADLSGMDALLDLMFVEAFSDLSGRQAVLDRLCEVLIIWLLRHCIDAKLTKAGVLGGMSDARLAKALQAMHAHPAKAWDLPGMAAQAGMSRARFAARFKELVGDSPADYLMRWRLLNAQRLLKNGRALQHVAEEVGYGSASALSRAFSRTLGCTPTQWLKAIALESTALETMGEHTETMGTPQGRTTS